MMVPIIASYSLRFRRDDNIYFPDDYEDDDGPNSFVKSKIGQGNSEQSNFNQGNTEQGSFNQGNFGQENFNQGNFGQENFNQGSAGQGNFEQQNRVGSLTPGKYLCLLKFPKIKFSIHS